MKILKFETKNHPILGECSLDFSRIGAFSDFVLIAGANGSGKTTILNEIFDFMSRIYPRDQIYDISITFGLDSSEINILSTVAPLVDSILKIDSLKKSDTGGVSWEQIKAHNSKQEINDDFTRGDIFQNLLKVVYSTVEINFTTIQISSTTAKNIDNEKAPKEKSSADISKDITQLLVDIKALDNQDAADWMDSNHGQQVHVTLQEKRISRFKKAFDSIIEGKTFQGVKNENEKKKVYFRDLLGNEIDISNLSSGEKQIVFRAGYLLKNIGSLSGGIVLIDEPEISFHPSWQEKYIKFVRNIFSNSNGEMQAQIIIATHSPFIIQNINITDEKIIILEKKGKDTIESTWPEFYGYKKPEPIFIPIQAVTRPLLLVEGESDKRIITHAWDKLYATEPIYFDIKWAGEPSTGGAGVLQRQLITLQQHAIEKVVGLFDADEKGLNEFNGTKVANNTDFIIDNEINNLKIKNKVGATFLPALATRSEYFNISYPKFSLLTIELYFNDATLSNLGILETDKIKISDVELLKIKSNHGISDVALEALDIDDFENFKILFEHLKRCFDKIK
jgi:predicted ATP-binding protein involved in virulence